MLIDNGVIKIGMEIEVAEFKPDRTYQKVAGQLIDANYMMGPESRWSEYHNYHCTCKGGGCYIVRKGDIVIPPLVSLTYDGSLPSIGAEFIISPILMADGSGGLAELKNIWDIIANNAVWSQTGKNIHGGPVSPSVHLHVSVTAKKLKGPLVGIDNAYGQDIIHALELFSPELFVLAEAGISNRRGLEFRWPDRTAMLNDSEGQHHGFVQVRASMPNEFIHIEWRLFEAAYTDWQYIESCIYLSSVLTRALLDRKALGTLLMRGYEHFYDEDQLREAVNSNDLNLLLNMVDGSRLNALKEICLEQIHDDNYGFHLLDNLFQRAEKEFI